MSSQQQAAAAIKTRVRVVLAVDSSSQTAKALPRICDAHMKPILERLSVLYATDDLEIAHIVYSLPTLPNASAVIKLRPFQAISSAIKILKTQPGSMGIGQVANDTGSPMALLEALRAAFKLFDYHDSTYDPLDAKPILHLIIITSHPPDQPHQPQPVHPRDTDQLHWRNIPQAIQERRINLSLILTASNPLLYDLYTRTVDVNYLSQVWFPTGTNLLFLSGMTLPPRVNQPSYHSITQTPVDPRGTKRRRLSDTNIDELIPIQRTDIDRTLLKRPRRSVSPAHYFEGTEKLSRVASEQPGLREESQPYNGSSHSNGPTSAPDETPPTVGRPSSFPGQNPLVASLNEDVYAHYSGDVSQSWGYLNTQYSDLPTGQFEAALSSTYSAPGYSTELNFQELEAQYEPNDIFFNDTSLAGEDVVPLADVQYGTLSAEARPYSNPLQNVVQGLEFNIGGGLSSSPHAPPGSDVSIIKRPDRRPVHTTDLSSSEHLSDHDGDKSQKTHPQGASDGSSLFAFTVSPQRRIARQYPESELSSHAISPRKSLSSPSSMQSPSVIVSNASHMSESRASETPEIPAQPTTVNSTTSSNSHLRTPSPVADPPTKTSQESGMPGGEGLMDEYEAMDALRTILTHAERAQAKHRRQRLKRSDKRPPAPIASAHSSAGPLDSNASDSPTSSAPHNALSGQSPARMDPYNFTQAPSSSQQDVSIPVRDTSGDPGFATPVMDGTAPGRGHAPVSPGEGMSTVRQEWIGSLVVDGLDLTGAGSQMLSVPVITETPDGQNIQYNLWPNGPLMIRHSSLSGSVDWAAFHAFITTHGIQLTLLRPNQDTAGGNPQALLELSASYQALANFLVQRNSYVRINFDILGGPPGAGVAVYPLIGDNSTEIHLVAAFFESIPVPRLEELTFNQPDPTSYFTNVSANPPPSTYSSPPSQSQHPLEASSFIPQGNVSHHQIPPQHNQHQQPYFSPVLQTNLYQSTVSPTQQNYSPQTSLSSYADPSVLGSYGSSLNHYSSSFPMASFSDVGIPSGSNDPGPSMDAQWQLGMDQRYPSSAPVQADFSGGFEFTTRTTGIHPTHVRSISSSSSLSDNLGLLGHGVMPRHANGEEPRHIRSPPPDFLYPPEALLDVVPENTALPSSLIPQPVSTQSTLNSRRAPVTRSNAAPQMQSYMGHPTSS